MITAPIQVQMTDVMGTDMSVVNAARVSFDKRSEWDYGFALDADGCKDYSAPTRKLNDADCKLIRYLAEHNHWSPFSHAFASFRIKAPIFVARQLVKHTVGLAWNEVSRRYVSSEPEFYLPDYWRKSASNVKQGSSAEVAGHFNIVAEKAIDRCLKTYQLMLDEGVCAEQARMILPQNTMTEWVWSGSLYAFARVCNLRLDSHTQVETREVAQGIHKAMQSKFPESWKVLVKP